MDVVIQNALSCSVRNAQMQKVNYHVPQMRHAISVTTHLERADDMIMMMMIADDFEDDEDDYDNLAIYLQVSALGHWMHCFVLYRPVNSEVFWNKI